VKWHRTKAQDICLRLSRRAREARARDRGNASARRLRSSETWKKVRRAQLRRFPICQRCEAQGRTTAAQEVHHIESVAARPDLVFVLENLMSLCRVCHVEIERGAR